MSEAVALRSPLAEGRRYCYPEYPGAGFRVRTIRMPDSPHHDGGLPGVSVEFFGHRPFGRRTRVAWIAARNVAEFWSKPMFRRAVDIPIPKNQRPARRRLRLNRVVGCELANGEKL